MKAFFGSKGGRIITILAGVLMLMALVLVFNLCGNHSNGDDNKKGVDSKGLNVVEDGDEDVINAANWEDKSDDNKKSASDNKQTAEDNKKSGSNNKQNTKDNKKDSDENQAESDNDQDVNEDNNENDSNDSDDNKGLHADNDKVPGADKVWGPLH